MSVMYENPKGSMYTVGSDAPFDGPVVLVPLHGLDGLAGTDSTTFGWVIKTSDKSFVVPGGRLDSAIGRVISKWTLLSGRMVYRRNDKIWCLRVPKGPLPARYRTHAYTHELEKKPLPSMPFEYSSIRLHTRPRADMFRNDSSPDSLSSYGSAQLPIISFATTTYTNNCVTIGMTVPNGALGADGIGLFLSFLEKELNGEAWEAPSLKTKTNELSEALEKLSQSDIKEQQNLPMLTRDLVKGTWTNWFFLMLGILWEFAFKRVKAKALFFPEDLCERMAERIKGEVRVESSGEDWVSTGDALFAWFLRSSLAGETNNKSLIASHSITSIQPALSLKNYPHNATIPSFFPTLPISSLRATPIFVLALLHRRTLTSTRTPIYLTKSIPLILSNPTPLPYRRFSCTNFIFSNLTTILPVMKFGGVGVVEQEYCFESPWEVDNKITIRKVEGGYLFEGTMRNNRWKSVEAELSRLEVGSTVTSPRLS